MKKKKKKDYYLIFSQEKLWIEVDKNLGKEL